MRKYVLIALGLIVLIAAAVLFAMTRPDVAKLPEDAVMGVRPNITTPRNQILPTVGIAEVVGWQGAAKPVAAAGLQVAAFAKGLDHPRWLYRLPNGDVLVAESNSTPRKGGGIKGWVMKTLMGRAGAGVASPNRIILLRDANGDGVAEARSVFLSGLNSPFGMVLVGDWLYVGNTDALVRFPYKAGETKITAAAEKIADLPGGGNHWARNVVAAPGGKSLYVTVGSSSNIAENGMDAEKRRAGILEVFPETKYVRIYATGLRNPNGMAFEPQSGRLWTVVNERDQLGSDVPPDYMAAVDIGDNFGWPWYYWGGYPDRRVEPANPALQEYSKRPDYALGAHTASLGLAFAGDAKLGTRFANGAFVTQHGSWNREPPAGYKMLYIPFGPNGFPDQRAKPVTMLSGFLNDEGKAQGRPVGVITDRTGALLVADDVGNVIWRVTGS
ncbi:sorbosone dehydrogenase family protein [Sphingomonas donggukensis]|uniref:Sorbosone dehydrogenase family protein n=1 Tax=Sphingomonas donggukensis TaxID=2949093 RepID=A0ABY4TRV9_9SPHN|nr:sorbosone dehydrogenase family protein [Sphingomonas donggukensis]URW75137.1 sorbosone dehydrogenase family protein [Sphingomonas donggukensis]